MALRVTLTSAVIMLVTACSSSPSLQDCASDADCGAGNLCHGGSCAVNAPPVADFDPPGSVTTNRVVSLLPSISDPEGRSVETRWSVAAVSGGCAPDVEPTTGSALEVAFWCSGTYEATLIPVDDLGLEGAAVVRSFEVIAATGAPSVAAGPPISATHRCDLGAGTCVVLGPDGTPSLQFDAVATDPGGAPLNFRWRSLPPPLPAEDPLLLVTFIAGAESDRPIVSIANGSGGPIAGVYRFRVRATNPEGLIGQTFQEVAVENGAPTAAPSAWLLPHTYADGTFVAEGDVATTASDPDGDALSVQGALDPAPPASCNEEVAPGALPGTLHVRIACGAAADLIGAAPRTLAATITDANGASVAVSAPLPIENRAPVITLVPSFKDGILAVNHRVEPCILAAGPSCFVADGTDPFVAVDPDGDPLGALALAVLVANGGSSVATITFDGGLRGFRVETPVNLPAEFRTPLGITRFSLTSSVQDPWALTAARETPISILNRAPIVKEEVPKASVPHVYDVARRRYVVTAPGALFEDPDGDPLIPSVNTGSSYSATIAGGRATISRERAWDYMLSGVPPLQAFLLEESVAVSASDGWESVWSTTGVKLLDQPTAVSVPNPVVENCQCIKTLSILARWGAGGSGIRVPVETTDLDGDPARVVVEPLTTAPEKVIGYQTCLPGLCSTTVAAFANPEAASSVSFSALVKADSGAGNPPDLVVKVTVTCGKVGLCTP